MKTSIAQPVSVRLENKNRKNIDHFSKITKRSRSFIINAALEDYLKDRIKYLGELDDAVSQAENGEIHTSDEIHTWMKSWGTKNELPSPRKA